MSFADNAIAQSSVVKITPSDIEARLSPILLTVPGAAKVTEQAKIAAVVIIRKMNILRKVIALTTAVTGYIIAMQPTQ